MEGEKIGRREVGREKGGRKVHTDSLLPIDRHRTTRLPLLYPCQACSCINTHTHIKNLRDLPANSDHISRDGAPIYGRGGREGGREGQRQWWTDRVKREREEGGREART